MCTQALATSTSSYSYQPWRHRTSQEVHTSFACLAYGATRVGLAWLGRRALFPFHPPLSSVALCPHPSCAPRVINCSPARRHKDGLGLPRRITRLLKSWQQPLASSFLAVAERCSARGGFCRSLARSICRATSFFVSIRFVPGRK